MQLTAPVLVLLTVGPQHPTAGLPGYPAHDWFAPAGSPALSPVDGVVTRLSGHDPKHGPVDGAHGPFAWSVYVQGVDAHSYYLTHLGTREVSVGQKVHRGQMIGTVANFDRYGTPSHVHMGVR